MSCRQKEKVGEDREKGKWVRAIHPCPEDRGFPRSPVKNEQGPILVFFPDFPLLHIILKESEKSAHF